MLTMQVIEMASSRYESKGFLTKKLRSQHTMVISSLRKENAYLRKTLAEMSRQHAEHYKLVELFLSLESVKRLTGLQLKPKEEKIALPSEQLSDEEKKPTDEVSMRRKDSIPNYTTGTEEMENKHVSISSSCQYLENRIAGKKDSTSDEGASSNKIRELQNHLSDALEKNKQWLEYDQQREAYVRANLARILRLEKQLNEANQARSQRQHNEDHSDEKERMNQLQESFEQLLQKANNHLMLIREKNDMTNQNLLMTHQRFKEMERRVEELKQQLQAEEMSRKSAAEDQHCSEEEREQEQCMLDRHHADREKIKDLERQVQFFSQDLEDERLNCSYLKKLMVRVLKMLQKKKESATRQPKREQQYRSSGEEARPPCMPPRNRHTSSSLCSGLNESFLECPSCQAEYPANNYRELMSHLETCLN
ncbi:centrosomal protein of 55 kDa-like isoform X3 [Acanthopagrus latus]|uniref:centrosomal protein of 55 kDa-like isoform X3 n=1 Tax=Acanthopagrus latus TaxID=8177 RepID=UPI00187C0910|nr:centrosomal protein of 55 kDa-like isoform X3 [Acanthopagrus latus]